MADFPRYVPQPAPDDASSRFADEVLVVIDRLRQRTSRHVTVEPHQQDPTARYILAELQQEFRGNSIVQITETMLEFALQGLVRACRVRAWQTPGDEARFRVVDRPRGESIEDTNQWLDGSASPS